MGITNNSATAAFGNSPISRHEFSIVRTGNTRLSLMLGWQRVESAVVPPPGQLN